MKLYMQIFNETASKRKGALLPLFRIAVLDTVWRSATTKVTT